MNTIKSIHHQIVPPDATIAELEAKAAGYEEKSVNEPEPRVTRCGSKRTYIEDGLLLSDRNTGAHDRILSEMVSTVNFRMAGHPSANLTPSVRPNGSFCLPIKVS